MEPATAGALLGRRKRASLSQVDVATRAGVTQSVISAHESGQRQPSIPALARLVDAAGSELTLGLRRRTGPVGRLSGPVGRRVRRHRKDLLADLRTMSYREHQAADIQAAIDAIRFHLQRGDLTDGLIFDAVRTRLLEIGEAVKALPDAVPTRPPRKVPRRHRPGPGTGSPPRLFNVLSRDRFMYQLRKSSKLIPLRVSH